MRKEQTIQSEKYIYIMQDKKEKISNVREFREKPDLERAKTYLLKGALWNGGGICL